LVRELVEKQFLIPVAEPLLGKEELSNVTKAVESGWISSKGEFIEQFEEEFAKYCGVKYGIATSNGTSALHLALVSLGIGPRDAVLVPTLTFVASANVVIYTGAKPVFIDSQPDYWCLDPDKIPKRVGPHVKAILPVHLYGHPCDMDAIQEFAEDKDLLIIEDCAEAHGAEFRGKRVGSFGNVSCFSFYGNKIITTGEGGMCLTDDYELAEKMRLLRDHGMSRTRSYWHEVVGFNYRMTNLQAAVGVAQLSKIDYILKRKREIAHSYEETLRGVSGLSFPKEMPWAKHVFWMYSILINPGIQSSRDALASFLRTKRIETRPFFSPIHKLPPYVQRKGYPVAEKLAERGLNLPSSPNLTLKQQDEICSAIQEFRKIPA
jgi:perosamine synthetase